MSLLKESLQNLIRKLPQDQFLLLDDESIFTEIYLKLLETLNKSVRKISFQELNAALTDSDSKNYALILPALHFRIFNINYDRKNQKPLAMKPYWVHIHSAKKEILITELGKYFAAVLCNPLENDPELLKNYLEDFYINTWLTGPTPQERHNDFQERQLWKKYFDLSEEDLYKKTSLLRDQSIEDYLFDLLKLEWNGEYSHMPIHSLRAYFKLPDLPINELERELYGQAY